MSLSVEKSFAFLLARHFPHWATTGTEEKKAIDELLRCGVSTDTEFTSSWFPHS
jgi:hypothetical protein